MSEKVEGGLEVVAEAYNHRSRDSMQVTVINIRQIGRLREGDKLVRQSDAERALAEQKALTRTAAGFDLPGMLETIKRLEPELQLEREAHRKTWRQLEHVTGLLREQRDILATWRDEGFGDVWVARIDAALSQQAEPSEPKCRTCRDVGIIGHSTICPECADTWSPPVEQAEPAPAQDEREAFESWSVSTDKYHPSGYNPHSDLSEAFHAGAEWQRTRHAQTEQQPVAFIDPADLERFSAGKMQAMTVTIYASGSGLASVYAAPIAQTAPQPIHAIPCRKFSASAANVPACRSDCNCSAAPIAQTDALKALRKVCDQWERQKGLFPELSQDGWMDLAVAEARAALSAQGGDA